MDIYWWGCFPTGIIWLLPLASSKLLMFLSRDIVVIPRKPTNPSRKSTTGRGIVHRAPPVWEPSSRVSKWKLQTCNWVILNNTCILWSFPAHLIPFYFWKARQAIADQKTIKFSRKRLWNCGKRTTLWQETQTRTGYLSKTFACLSVLPRLQFSICLITQTMFWPVAVTVAWLYIKPLQRRTNRWPSQ